MKIFYCTIHALDTSDGVGPKVFGPARFSGTSIVVAETEQDARKLLKAALAKEFPPGADHFMLTELDLTSPAAVMLGHPAGAGGAKAITTSTSGGGGSRPEGPEECGGFPVREMRYIEPDLK